MMLNASPCLIMLPSASSADGGPSFGTFNTTPVPVPLGSLAAVPVVDGSDGTRVAIGNVGEDAEEPAGLDVGGVTTFLLVEVVPLANTGFKTD